LYVGGCICFLVVLLVICVGLPIQLKNWFVEGVVPAISSSFCGHFPRWQDPCTTPKLAVSAKKKDENVHWAATNRVFTPRTIELLGT